MEMSKGKNTSVQVIGNEVVKESSRQRRISETLLRELAQQEALTILSRQKSDKSNYDLKKKSMSY